MRVKEYNGRGPGNGLNRRAGMHRVMRFGGCDSERYAPMEFGIIPECRSASPRNERSASPESPQSSSVTAGSQSQSERVRVTSAFFEPIHNFFTDGE